ncbi:VWA domain-containing protein [bacterium]|nr:VWA domain-containing protein [bacterium]
MSLIFALLLAFVPAHRALADGIMIPPPDVPIHDAFAIRYHRVTVDIQDGFVRTEIDQEFENLTGRRIQADYVFPMPAGAVLQNFAMWVGGEKITGEVLPAAEARRIYEDIVRAQLDPALLEYIGNDAFRARVFPIEPGERKRIVLSYTQVLQADNGVYEYVYPLNTEKFSARLIDEVTVSGKIEATVPIKTVYSPSHAISVSRKDDTHASFSYEEANVRPNIDFVLYYSVDAREIGASLLAYDADDSEDGFFLATLTPRVESDAKVINKNFLFVLDKSGSMQDDDKIEQAKGALRFVLRNLNEGDRFNVIAYSDELWTCFEDGMKTWSGSTRDKALDFVRQFDAVGGTNINEALLRALDMLKAEGGEKPGYIVFLTDGLPTVGVTDEGSIIENVTNANRRGARLFAFGVGYDVNTHLLDKLSESNHGITEYVRPGESIEVKVSSFYSKISSPVLTGVKLRFGGVKVKELYPREMPDLFKGEQVIIAGRFTPGAGSATIELTGKVDGKSKNFRYPVSFKGRSSYSFVPRVWAGRKIGYLTDEIRLHGTNDELIEEIVRLSKRYGIITEYTSFLIRDEDTFFASEEDNLARARGMGIELEEVKSGAGGVGQSQTAQRLKGDTAGGQGTANAPAAYYDIAGREVQVTSINYLDDLTFFLIDDYWTDSRFDPEIHKVIEVKAFSDAYFRLLEDGQVLNRQMAQGEQVIIVLDSENALKISREEGQESLSDDEVSRIQQQIASVAGNGPGANWFAILISAGSMWRFVLV